MPDVIVSDVFGTLPTPVSVTGKPHDIDEIKERMRRLAAQRWAPNTIKAYQKAWKRYAAWCEQKSFPVGEYQPEVMALYITELAHGNVEGQKKGAAPATINIHVAAITTAYRLLGFAVDSLDDRIKAVKQGISRSKGNKPTRQARPLLSFDTLPELISALPRNETGARDKALLLTGFGAALRRSEIVALNMGDVEFADKGIILSIGRSKTDQEGAGDYVAIHKSENPLLDPVAALRLWYHMRKQSLPKDTPLEEQPLFAKVLSNGKIVDRRIGESSISYILKRAAEDAYLDAALYSSHSLRSGLITSAAEKGFTLEQIMPQSRHKSYQVAMMYVRRTNLWKQNVTESLLA